MSISGLVITLLLVVAAVWWGRNGASLPGRFQNRACQGTGWRRAFPHASKGEIRSFLTVFVDAFALHESQRLKFNPGDSILGVYRALYPHRWLPDALEVETLASSVETIYGVKLEELWSERLTLGELFAATQSNAPARSDA